MLGRLIIGILADIVDPWLLAFSSLMGTCLTIFVLWGLLGYSLAGLIAFGLVYGSIGGAWSSMWSGFIRQVASEYIALVLSPRTAFFGDEKKGHMLTGGYAGDDPQLFATITGYLMLSRGIGNVLSTPISTAISTRGTGSTNSATLGFNVGGGKFENVIIYTGTCFAGAVLISGMGWGWDRTRSTHRRD